MDARMAFKQGFISHCIEQGLTTAPEMSAQLEKLANGVSPLVFTGVESLKELWDSTKGVLGTGLSWGVPLALAAPPVAGAVAGTMASRATDVGDFDVAEAKQQEIVDEYRRQAARAKRQGALHRYESARGRSNRVFL